MAVMKRAALLSAAACSYVGAASLRGDGVEEVGEQIEAFPPEDYYVDRRLLSDADVDADARATMEEYFDEWPDQDVVGSVVEDEDEIYVQVYQRAEGEEDTFEDMLPPEWSDADEEWSDDGDVVDEWSEEDVVGTLVEVEDWSDEDAAGAEVIVEDEGGSELPVKQSGPDPSFAIFEGTSLNDVETYDQNDRRETAKRKCFGNKSDLFVMFKTDNYGWETKWSLTNTDTKKVVATGPPTRTNYARKTAYTGMWCLPNGNYNFELRDTNGDGMCSVNAKVFGCGAFLMTLNGAKIADFKQGKDGWTDPWSKKKIKFSVTPFDSRIGGVPRPNPDGEGQGQWCRKVRSKMQIPRGQCKTPGGTQGHRVRMSTTVDKYGKETSWQITNNNVVKMKLGAVIEKNDSKSVESCLPAGKYVLKVMDLDGICCRHGQGGFTLDVNGETLLTGGSFQGSISHTFQLGYDWISTMNERDCEWWWAHDYRRRDWHTRCYKGYYCGKDYRHLKWSPKLKYDAKDYAERLLATCDTVGIKHDKTDQGENLAKNKGSGAWGQLYAADKITKRFVDNEEFWGWNANAHLTQAMWYPSRYIGCGESVKDMGKGKMCRMQVCRFAKAGNCMMSQFDSEKGNNWMIPTFADDSKCGPMCPPQDGCYL